MAVSDRLTLREHLLLYWGSLHIGEVIRRVAFFKTVQQTACSKKSAFRVLDAGCGRGDNALRMARRYPRTTVTAVDIDTALTKLLSRRVNEKNLTNCQVVTADITKPLPFSEHFDLIYSIDVFEHLENPALALQNLSAHLVPNGLLLLHVPRLQQRRWFKKFTHYHQDDHAQEGYEPTALQNLFKGAGLSIIAVRHTFGPPGALAWELYHLAHAHGKLAVLLIYPWTRLLASIDMHIRWKRGNGILILASARA